MPNQATSLPEIPKQDTRPNIDCHINLTAAVHDYLELLKSHYGDLNWCINQIVLSYKACHPVMSLFPIGKPSVDVKPSEAKPTGKVANA